MITLIIKISANNSKQQQQQAFCIKNCGSQFFCVRAKLWPQDC